MSGKFDTHPRFIGDNTGFGGSNTRFGVSLWVLHSIYLLSARNIVPMTKEEAETLWKLHTQKDCCKAKTWHEITKRNKVVGYECECGLQHIQKKHLVTVG